MKEAFIADVVNLLHDYIAEGEWQDVNESKTFCHIDGHNYKFEIKVTRE